MNVLLSSFSGASMNDKLIYAGANAAAGSVIDCTSYTGTQSISRTINVTRSLTFIFGNVTLSANFTAGDINSHIFWVLADNVRFEGVSRTSNATANGYTRFVMTNQARGYHVFVGNNAASGGTTWTTYNNFSMANIDCQGIQSVITNNTGSPVYGTTGSGGVFVLSGNPSSETSTVSNVRIDNVWVSGSRTHGIFLYNALNSKLTNCRVSSTAGHGIFLYKGKGNSLDTCFATGCNLAGFSIKENNYTSLTSCASDSNGMGYIIQESMNCTLTSCGAEANVIRVTQPNNLGITMAASTPFTLVDVGAEAAFRFKGTSFWLNSSLNVQGCESNSLISCYSKDPSNVLTGVFTSEYTAHFGLTGYVRNCSIISPNTTGTAVTKYIFRLDESTENDGFLPAFNTINYRALTYDPTNPAESPNGSFTLVATVLDQGNSNIFELAGSVKSFNTTSQTLVKTDAYANVNREKITDTLVIPTYTSHPTVPGNHPGGMYFNTTVNKLYMWNNGWYDTCCSTVTTPPCVWPSGFTYPESPQVTDVNRRDIKFLLYDNVGYLTSNAWNASNPPSYPNQMSSFQVYDLSNNAFYNIAETQGIDQWEWLFDIGQNSSGDLCTYALGYVPDSAGIIGNYNEGTRIWMRNTVAGQVSFLDEPGDTEIPGTQLTMGGVKVAADKLWVFFISGDDAFHKLTYIKSYSLDDLTLIDSINMLSLYVLGYQGNSYYSYGSYIVFDEINNNFIFPAVPVAAYTVTALMTFNIDTNTVDIVGIGPGPITSAEKSYPTLHIGNGNLYIGCVNQSIVYVHSLTSGPYDYITSIATGASSIRGLQTYSTGTNNYLFIVQAGAISDYENPTLNLMGYNLDSNTYSLATQIVPSALNPSAAPSMVMLTPDVNNNCLWLNIQEAFGPTQGPVQLIKTCLPAD